MAAFAQELSPTDRAALLATHLLQFSFVPETRILSFCSLQSTNVNQISEDRFLLLHVGLCAMNENIERRGRVRNLLSNWVTAQFYSWLTLVSIPSYFNRKLWADRVGG